MDRRRVTQAVRSGVGQADRPGVGQADLESEQPGRRSVPPEDSLKKRGWEVE